MTRADIVARFRQESPEITKNVAADTVLQSWVEIGNLEVATRARLIKGEKTFPAIVGEDTYNLSAEIPKFYDIDEYPGGGVAFDNNRLDVETIAGLDAKRPSWRVTGNGIPTDYYRRMQNLVLGRNSSSTDNILVYTVLIADALDSDTKTPFNELTYLEPFHYSLVLYLKMRAFAGKIKKPEASASAQQEFNDYVKWMKLEVERGIYKSIQIRPPNNYRGTSRFKTR